MRHRTTRSRFPVYSEVAGEIGLPRAAALALWGVPAGVRDERSDGIAFCTPDLALTIAPTTEPPQDQALANLDESFAAPASAAMLVLPCGAGKTAVSVMAAYRRGRRALVVVPDDDLGRQWKARICAYIPGARVGIIKGDKVDVDGSDFVVVTVHSMYQRTHDTDVMATFGTVIIDEAHHMAAPCFSRALRQVPARCVLALSATPDRPDGLTPVLHWLMGDVAFRCQRAYTHVNVRFVRCQAADGVQERLAGIQGKAAGVILSGILAKNGRRNDMIVREVRVAVRTGGHKVIVLTKLREHRRVALR